MRRILLTLAEDTTETHCGSCPHIGEPHGDWCSVWGALPIWRKRLPECLAAEAAAARMVEIAPEDARDGEGADTMTEQAENLLWNLAGCDTIASSGTPTTFDASMARPALHAVNQMATRLADAEAQLAELTARAEKAEQECALLSARNIELARALPDERVRGACQVIRAMPIPADVWIPPQELEALKVFDAWLSSLDAVR